VDLTTLGLTLQVAAVATAINLPFALVASWLLAKRDFRGRFLLDVLVSLPLAVPPVAIGFFMLILLGRDGVIGGPLHDLLGIDIVFTWFAAALASAVVSFPLMARAMIVAMGDVDGRLEMSARSLGAGPLRVVMTITFPLAYRGILSGVLLGFVRALSEFGATIVVAGNTPGRTQTLPLAIYTRVQVGDNGLALQLVAISIGLAVVTLLAHNWLLERSRARRNT
jgi:molybdate transport system permease protein